MYDHNQTLVPDSFLALYAPKGRLLLERSELEARYELAETLALHIAEVIVNVPANDEAARNDALRSVEASLLTEPSQVNTAEAAWVVTRAAEICEWPVSPDR